jgi:hypothetical protein
MEKKYTNLDDIAMTYEYADHFVSLKQLIYSPWGFGYSVPGTGDGMSFQLGPFHWLLALLSLTLLFYSWLKRQKIDWQWVFFGLLFGVSIVAMLPVSLPIWKALPFVHYVQFPWRLLAFATLAVAGLTAQLVKTWPKLTFTIIGTALVYVSVVASTPGGWFDWDNQFYFRYPFSTSLNNANTPKWFEENENYNLKEGRMFDLQGVGSFRPISWKTQKHVYEITAPQDTEVLERTAYFPGWEVRLDGQKTAIDYQKPEYPGIITYRVPQGTHLVEVKFTENTPSRILGDSVSLISLAILIWIMKKWD